MNLTRRGFMKATGAAFATSMAFQLTQQSPALAVESNSDWKLVNTEEYTNICCYCAGGCRFASFGARRRADQSRG